ncbi:hypothetical protein HMPREF1982_00193 [Clostridiales bacterium oral taxon 876 str. F0540]|nr:hypothetical protein HMPREF1982_00193 [Clostridiales bacterium oral taxon 876 str. F0540]
MTKATPVLDLRKYRKLSEKFISGVPGGFKLNFFFDIFYSFLPYPFFNYFPPSIYTISIDCIFAITDKRIIILEKNSDGDIDENYIHSLNYDEVKIEFKKKLGTRIFVIEKLKKNYFSMEDNMFRIEINKDFITQAENINTLLSEYKIN